MNSAESGRWHAALAYALLGPPVRDIDEPATPQIDRLLDDLGGVAVVRTRVRATRSMAQPWPHEVPVDLRAGLGAAQYAAAWRNLLAALGPLTTDARPVVTDRALTAEERRLSADRPPHHGG